MYIFSLDLSKASVTELTSLANKMIGNILRALEELSVSIGKNKMEDNPRMANIANILMNWEERKDIIQEEYQQLLRDIENIKKGDVDNINPIINSSQILESLKKTQSKSKPKLNMNSSVRQGMGLLGSPTRQSNQDYLYSTQSKREITPLVETSLEMIRRLSEQRLIVVQRKEQINEILDAYQEQKDIKREEMLIRAQILIQQEMSRRKQTHRIHNSRLWLILIPSIT
ncbi:MAG: hypothetical protein EZS28_001882 [Streblomastix strix]|uniref:Uncharacterized protein n=1 Tax=Streblomastix strix TaxID=222440 RepID=A0A5J4X7T2_9EUKA|nr:MAG: hypothetical protein EZS28_001882 [Streblomastix strix]